LALYLADRADLPWTLTTVAVVGPLVAIEAMLRWLVQGRGRKFEKQLTSLLQSGRDDELLPLYARQRLLRFASPRHLTHGKLGLIYARLGKHTLAAAAYREALDDAPHNGGYTLALGLADSLYETGEHAEAERVYRGAIDDEHINVRACANLARLIIRRRGDLEEAESYLKMGVRAARGGALRCELARLLLERGKLTEAQDELATAEKELEGSEDKDDLAALELARSALGKTAPPQQAAQDRADPEDREDRDDRNDSEEPGD